MKITIHAEVENWGELRNLLDRTVRFDASAAAAMWRLRSKGGKYKGFVVVEESRSLGQNESRFGHQVGTASPESGGVRPNEP